MVAEITGKRLSSKILRLRNRECPVEGSANVPDDPAALNFLIRTSFNEG